MVPGNIEEKGGLEKGRGCEVENRGGGSERGDGRWEQGGNVK